MLTLSPGGGSLHCMIHARLWDRDFPCLVCCNIPLTSFFQGGLINFEKRRKVSACHVQTLHSEADDGAGWMPSGTQSPHSSSIGAGSSLVLALALSCPAAWSTEL